MLSRTRDGQRRNAPRELIHLADEIRVAQLKRFERGEQGPEADFLFERAAVKEALLGVSQIKLEQTIYAEYPDARPWIDNLRGQKAEQDSSTLTNIWMCAKDEAIRRSERLIEIGFFEYRQDRESYWVPFLFRDALELVQGRAEND